MCLFDGKFAHQMARVVVGLSGGVDSSVAALLLKQDGHEVIGLFMRNWNDASVTLEDDCPWIDDSRDAMLIAEQLDIPFQVLDLSVDYKTRIVDYMFNEYEAGRTPNPDVLCNREIKFDIFLKNALKLGADFVATGHYVQKTESIINGNRTYHLLAGEDPNKDQSYFLCQLTQGQLSKALFPIGGLLKPEVRRLAEEAKLVTAAKKDSQGLCFIGKVSLPEFLQQKLSKKVGDVIEISANAPKVLAYLKMQNGSTNPVELAERPVFLTTDGIKVGTHQGAHFYTLGQRKGLHIGGMVKPLFVLQTDVVNNIVYVGQGDDHPALSIRALTVDGAGMHWLRDDLALNIGETQLFEMRVRYRQNLFHGELINLDGKYFAKFQKAQKAVTPGQFLAIYHHAELIASAVIY